MTESCDYDCAAFWSSKAGEAESRARAAEKEAARLSARDNENTETIVALQAELHAQMKTYEAQIAAQAAKLSALQQGPEDEKVRDIRERHFEGTGNDAQAWADIEYLLNLFKSHAAVVVSTQNGPGDCKFLEIEARHADTDLFVSKRDKKPPLCHYDRGYLLDAYRAQAAKLAAEHENFLSVHRDNMALVLRVADLKAKLASESLRLNAEADNYCRKYREAKDALLAAQEQAGLLNGLARWAMSACVDIFKDLSKDEKEGQMTSVRIAWAAGHDIVAADALATLPAPGQEKP